MKLNILKLVPSSFIKYLAGFLILISFSAEAAHLVGGQISYTCIGGNNYQIRLRVYRDCGGGGAQFDAQANIAIYDVNNILIRMLTPVKGPTINVPPDSTGNPCVTAPPGLCTEYAEYLDTVNLPPIAGGYVITHQRCCRNNSIANVNSSGTYGNTYTVSIPDNDTTCNSSPEFLGVAPIVLCLNNPVNLGLRASEPDGDSLHFEFCDILNGGASGGSGGGCNVTVPNPPCPPPYTAVPFASPFTSINPIPSLPVFQVDPLTGTLTGTPNQLGQYVVGICVTEYRNGMPLSTTRLDYQFNVASCISNVVSDMVTPLEDPSILCDGLTVTFESESQNVTSLLWDFGVSGTTLDTSTKAKPTYTYPGAGSYTVTLYANPGSPCGDTLKVKFDIKPEVIPDFRDSGVYCFEAHYVDFIQAGNYPVGTTFLWDFGADANFTTSTLENPPTITWTGPGKKYISLTITYGLCVKTKLDSIEISNLIVGVDAGPDQIIEEDELFFLSGTGGTQFYWWADQPVDIGNRFGQTTTARLERDQDTVKFYLRASDPLGCEGIDSMYVFVTRPSGPINFISPNGDGVNDVFDIGELNPDLDCKLTILNRWGTEVWAAEKYKNDWTGVNRGGNDLPDGTYYWILQCGNEVRHKDAVTILRNSK